MNGPAIPILLYHSISEQSEGPFAPYALEPEVFAKHVDVVVDKGFDTLTVSELRRLTASGRRLPERPAVLTFDDGFADFASAAWPLLRSAGLAATLYVTTGPLERPGAWSQHISSGRRPMLSAEQLVDLDSEGCEIGAHTVTHPQLDCIDRAGARQEIEQSRAHIETILGHPVRSFAYPHGYHDRKVRHMVIEAGFDSACAVKNLLSHPGDDRFALARVTIEADIGSDDLIRLLEGEGTALAGSRERVRTTAHRAVRRGRHRLGRV